MASLDSTRVYLFIRGMSLKSFDIFRKINTEDDQSTKTGGFLTIIAFIIGGLLLFQSLQ